MKRYLYNYQTAVTFSDEVTNHSILLRCQPMSGTYMNIEEEHLILPPGYNVRRGTDAFGNRIIYGSQRDPHTTLVYVSTGIVTMSAYTIRDSRGISPIYMLPTPLTTLKETFPAEHTENITDTAADICHKIHEMMTYTPQSTTVNTPAYEVYGQRQGVCQDYAHLMIAACRTNGIAARYACGFMEGTGETHAWVEIHNGYCWTGFDPTNDAQTTYGYVKIAHGRDAFDCPVNRGIYTGTATQETQINVTQKEI